MPGEGTRAGAGLAVAGVVLAAGAGSRLRPLTRLRPKPLCPVGNVPLVDRAVARLVPLGVDVAVNVHHGREAMLEHLAAGISVPGPSAGGGPVAVHASLEDRVALGTAGALGHLRRWLDGRAAVVVNADTYTSADPESVLDGWDGERPRVVLGGPASFGPRAAVVASVLPWRSLARMAAEPSGLYEVCWRPAWEEGSLDVVGVDATTIDCGTPAGYLAANLDVSGGASVVGEGATVSGTLERSVVWPGSTVARGEHLVDAIRAGPLTVLVR